MCSCGERFLLSCPPNWECWEQKSHGKSFMISPQLRLWWPSRRPRVAPVYSSEGICWNDSKLLVFTYYLAPCGHRGQPNTSSCRYTSPFVLMAQANFSLGKQTPVVLFKNCSCASSQGPSRHHLSKLTTSPLPCCTSCKGGGQRRGRARKKR